MLRISVDSPSPSEPAPQAGVSRRELRERENRRGRRRWYGALAAGLALALAGGTYGVLDAGGEAPTAALEAGGETLPRTGPASRGVARIPLEGGTEREIAVDVDGETHTLTTRARTLAEALREAGVVVNGHDQVSAPMHGPPTDVQIERVTESIETVEEKIPYPTTRTKTSSLTEGTERVQTQGRDGVRTATKRILRKDGEVIAEEVLAQAVGADPVTEVVLVGTQPRPAPAASSSSGSSTSASSSATSSSSASGGSAEAVPSTTAAATGSPRSIAQGMLSEFGWGQDQWSCLNSLWQRESNWNPRARNPSSGAYGIPQSLPGSKMASAGADWQTNPATQIRWGLGYIKGRYGSPCGAWGHSQQRGWY